MTIFPDSRIILPRVTILLSFPQKLNIAALMLSLAMFFMHTTFFFSNSSNRSAGEHLDVRLLLILPSPFILLFHPSPRCHSSLLLWAVKRMKGSVSLPRRERGGEVKRQRKRLESREQDHPACPYHFHLTAHFHIFIPCFSPCSIWSEYSCRVFAQNLQMALFCLHLRLSSQIHSSLYNGAHWPISTFSMVYVHCLHVIYISVW